MESTQGTRDIRFDMLRGIATLMVVFGHVLQYISQQIEVISTNGIVHISVGFVFVLVATFGIIAIIKKSKYLYGFVFGSKLKAGK